MKAIVLAAGFATRMYPLTRDRAKPLLDVAGKPVLSRLLDRVLTLDAVDEVLVVTNHRFFDQFELWSEGYLARVPVRVLDDGSLDDAGKRGAIADLAFAVEAIDEVAADLLVVAGDNLIDFDLQPHATRFAELGRPLCLVREIEGIVPPRRFSEVTLDGTRVLTCREKPAEVRSNLSAICLYFLPASVRPRLAEYLASQSEHDAPGHFIAWLHDREPLAASRIDGGWHDIGDLETLERARTAFGAQARGRAR
ncbi:MAG: sugar phosphate nucleotidyltransferase [Planctomycetota bacterium]